MGASKFNGTPMAADDMQKGTAAEGDGKTREELQAVARTLIDDLRSRDEPPEQILIQIKRYLADCGLKGGFPAGDGTAHTGGSALYRDIITWSIRYYYETDSRKG